MKPISVEKQLEFCHDDLQQAVKFNKIYRKAIIEISKMDCSCSEVAKQALKDIEKTKMGYLGSD